LQQALLLESSGFLAADRVLSSSEPVEESLLQQVSAMGLQQTRTLSFLSMVFAQDRAQLVAIKAVTDGYPLRGNLAVSDEPFVRGQLVTKGPAAGYIWLESRLVPSLSVALGDVLEIGEAEFIVEKVLTREPDRGGGFFSAGPRVMMNLDDIHKTGIIQPGSRVTWRYLFAGDPQEQALLDAWMADNVPEGMRYYGVKESTETIGKALSRAESFLLLGGLMGVILAGIAIALSARRYARRHYDHVAILKTLGATPLEIDRLFIVMLLALGVLATLSGALLGWLVQLGATKVLSPYIPVTLPAAGFKPILTGLATGLTCLLAFALPPVLHLRQTSPARVIRRDLDSKGFSGYQTGIYAVSGVLALMFWYSADLWLTTLVLAGAVTAGLVFGALAWLMLRAGRTLGMQAGSIWRLALAGMSRRGSENVLQILVFGLALMLLLVLWLVRTALIEEWQSRIPERAPNHFMINIAPQDVGPMEDLLAEQGIASQPLYPMIRGRISRINNETATDRDSQRRGDEPGPRAGSGRNLTWSSVLPADNKIIEGSWWPVDYQGDALVSIEADLARSSGIGVGDELVFTIQGMEQAATVASIRTVSWDNMQPNFFIIFSSGVLDQFASTFMSSFYLEKGNKAFLNRLLKAFPTITVIEVDAIIDQVQKIISRVSLAIELVLVLILIAGSLVLVASIQASMDERWQQQAIIRALGAGRGLIMGSLAIEFLTLGLFAGMVAALGAELTAYGVQTWVFELDYRLHPFIWVAGPLSGMVIIGSIGTLMVRKLISVPPAQVLRVLG
ncbi:MAG: ABC transporter permease, partial [Gammaproteobacteria bacterium]|nr:ABC transporter permease [Gammaproteobacteria bacterium]